MICSFDVISADLREIEAFDQHVENQIEEGKLVFNEFLLSYSCRMGEQ
jgi:hypothetical protein